ncbi:MAG TPA: hypothetical protein VGM62_18410, partial [Chthoniobacterales bacterium]
MTRFIRWPFLVAAALLLIAALLPIVSTGQDQTGVVRTRRLTDPSRPLEQQSDPLLDLPLRNGDFESPPSNIAATVTGWVVGGNVVEAAEGATSGSNSAVF